MQVVIELPYVLAQALVYGIIIYGMIGFEWTVTKVFWYLFFMYFTFLTFTYYGMMSVAVTPNQHISSIVSSAFYAVWNLFSGFIVPRPVSFGSLSNSCTIVDLYFPSTEECHNVFYVNFFFFYV